MQVFDVCDRGVAITTISENKPDDLLLICLDTLVT